MPDKTLQVLCELMIDWESQARDLYLKFANLFSNDPKISEFWLQLSKDESRHIDILKDILNKIPREKLLMDVSNEKWNSLTRVEGLIKEVSSKKIQTLNDAYEMAHQLETSEMNILLKMLVNEYLPDEEGYKFIFSDVTEHIEKLMRFGKEYQLSQRKHINSRNIK
ncbi:MAG: ferritin family protein [archaeon]